MNGDLLRDLKCDVERNEISKNDDQVRAQAVQRNPLRAVCEFEKTAFKNTSKFFFSQIENILAGAGNHGR